MSNSNWSLDFSEPFDFFDGFGFENKKLANFLYKIEGVFIGYKFKANKSSINFYIGNIPNSNCFVNLLSEDDDLVSVLNDEDFRKRIEGIIPFLSNSGGLMGHGLRIFEKGMGTAQSLTKELNFKEVVKVTASKGPFLYLQLSLLISKRLGELNVDGVDMGVFNYGLNLQNNDKNRGEDKMNYKDIEDSYMLWVLAGIIVFGVALAIYKKRQSSSKSPPNPRQSPVKNAQKDRYAIFCMKQQVAESNSIDLRSNNSSTILAIAKLADKSAFSEHGIDDLNGLKEAVGVEGGYVVMFVKDPSGICKSLDEGTLVASAEQFLAGDRAGDVIIYQNVSRDGLMNAGVQWRTRLN